LTSILLTRKPHDHENPCILSGTLTCPTISKICPDAVKHVQSVPINEMLGSARLVCWKC
jgi:hypothetical protein